MIFKKINKKENVFYVFEIETTKFSIFDSKLDTPIYHGNWNMCDGIIRSIKQNSPKSIIYYYIKEKSGSLKQDPQWSYNI